MEAKDLYSRINNPIDNPNIIFTLLKIYANADTFYKGLVKADSPLVIKNEKYHSTKESDEFYSMIFNNWKNNFISITENEYAAMTSDNLDKFIKLRNYLETISDIHTEEEFNNIISNLKSNSDFSELVKNFWGSSSTFFDSWTYVQSSKINVGLSTPLPTEHRLYLNFEQEDLFKVITLFIKKCNEYDIPYDFKFDKESSRNDDIVIYSHSSLLTKYVDILGEIKRENPELVSRAKETPLLTGKIDNWIGYGSEPLPIDGDLRSFNGVRAEALETTIDQIAKQWVLEHQDMSLNYNGYLMKVTDLISLKVLDSFMFFYKERIEHGIELHWSQHLKKDKGVKWRDVRQQLCEENEEFLLLDNPLFKVKILPKIREYVERNLSLLLSNRENEIEILEIETIPGTNIDIPRFVLRDGFRNSVVGISKMYPELLSKIQEEIRKTAVLYGIDPNNYCFDLDKKERLEQSEENAEIWTNPDEGFVKLACKALAEVKDAKIPYKGNIVTYSDYFAYYVLDQFILELTLRIDTSLSIKEQEAKYGYSLDTFKQEKFRNKYLSMIKSTFTEEFFENMKNGNLLKLELNAFKKIINKLCQNGVVFCEKFTEVLEKDEQDSLESEMLLAQQPQIDSPILEQDNDRKMSSGFSM